MILVTGGTGQLGEAILRLLPDAIHPGREVLDLARPDGISPILDHLAPDTIVNCAAYTAVDRAEEDEAVALAVNGYSVGAIAEWCARTGARLVTFSTDYVFDGTSDEAYVETSPTHPINVYGASKLVGERLVAESGAAAAVIRTAWLISATHPNFVSKILARARTGPVRVVTDQIGCPTFVDDLAAAALRLLDAGGTGVFHLVNDGSASWFDLAVAAVTAAGLDPELVEPTTSDAFPTTARRPARSVLGSERIGEPGVSTLPSWRERIGPAVAAMEGAGLP